MVVCVALAGCAAQPTPRSAAGPPPLGPCPASSWQPEAPPPAASTKVSMVLLAVGEWARFGKEVIVYSSDAPPRKESLGVKEREAPQRIQDYWASVGYPERSGLDDVPWSAAFISWVVQSAGVSNDKFCPGQRHTIYVERLVERARQPGAVLIPRRPEERRPAVGDLICASRNGSRTTLDNLNRGAGHCDLVVVVRPGAVEAIGGNVDDTVARSIFPLDGNGFLSPIAGRPVFTVIENTLPWE
jgi:hypothetical protein